MRPASRDTGLRCAVALVAYVKVKVGANEHSLKLRRSS